MNKVTIFIGFGLVGSLLTSCKGQEGLEGDTSCVNSIYSQASADVNTERPHVGGSFFFLANGDTGGKDWKRCTVDLVEAKGNTLTFATSLHCADYRKYESDTVRLSLRSTDNMNAEDIVVEGTISDPNFQKIEEVENHLGLDELAFEKILYTYVPKGNQGIRSCSDATLDVPNEFSSYAHACFSDKDISYIAVNLSNEGQRNFDSAFDFQSSLNVVSLQNRRKEVQNFHAREFLIELMSNQSRLDSFLLKYADKNLINDPFNVGYNELIESLSKNEITFEEFRSKVKELDLEQKTRFRDFLNSEREKFRSMSSNLVVLSVARESKFASDSSKGLYTAFNIETAGYGKAVPIEGGYALNSGYGAYLIGFNDNSPLRFEPGDSGSLMVAGNEIVAVISTHNGDPIQDIGSQVPELTKEERPTTDDISDINSPSRSPSTGSSGTQAPSSGGSSIDYDKLADAIEEIGNTRNQALPPPRPDYSEISGGTTGDTAADQEESVSIDQASSDVPRSQNSGAIDLRRNVSSNTNYYGSSDQCY